MNLKTVLCVAVIFSAVLAGCSSLQREANVAGQSEGQSFSNQEAVLLRSDVPSRHWELRWALTEHTWNAGELFLTVHERRNEFARKYDYDPESTAAVYVKVGNKFKLLKRLEGGASYFLKPTVVWMACKGEDREQLIQITEVFYGTGHFMHEHIFKTTVLPISNAKNTPDLKLDEVEFIPPNESFKEHLAKGEGVWKGVISTFTDSGLLFDFAIWNEGNGNCCPSAGTVTGAYKLERKSDGGLRISMDTFKREAIKN